jgi:hypothetical protein
MSHLWLVLELLLVFSQAPSVVYEVSAPEAPELLMLPVAVSAEG